MASPVLQGSKGIVYPATGFAADVRDAMTTLENRIAEPGKVVVSIDGSRELVN